MNTDYCTAITAMWEGRVCLVQNYLASRILIWLVKQASICWTTHISYHYNILLIITRAYSLKTHLSAVSKTVFGFTVETYNTSLDVRTLHSYWLEKSTDYCYSCIICLFSAIKYNIYIGILLCLLKFHEQDHNISIIMCLAD